MNSCFWGVFSVLKPRRAFHPRFLKPFWTHKEGNIIVLYYKR